MASDKEVSAFQAMVRDYAVWAFTAVSAFIGWQVFNMSTAVERLAVEVKYLAEERSS